MRNRDGLLQLRLTQVTSIADVVKALRAFTELSVSQITQGVRGQAPLPVARLYQLDHDSVADRALKLIATLEAAGVNLEILLDGRVLPYQHLLNLLESRQETSRQIEMESDLESGEPCIETLEQLKQGSRSAFLATLRQIERGEGYQVDEETMLWVKRELGSN